MTGCCTPPPLLQANQVAAEGAHKAAGEALQQGSAGLVAAMQGTVQQGAGLSAAVQQHAAAAAEQLEQHAGAVSTAVQQQAQRLGALCSEEQGKCGAGEQAWAVVVVVVDDVCAGATWMRSC